jgi:hypothetical protein
MLGIPALLLEEPKARKLAADGMQLSVEKRVDRFRKRSEAAMPGTPVIPLLSQDLPEEPKLARDWKVIEGEIHN